jgi:hypothetical protein
VRRTWVPFMICVEIASGPLQHTGKVAEYAAGPAKCDMSARQEK